MKKLLIVAILFLNSCTSNVVESDVSFSDDMSFVEFGKKLESYIKNNPYPKIDE